MKRGVSLYSFQEDYYESKRSLEDCIKAVAEIGAKGIETIAEQMMPGFPNLSDEFYEEFDGWMKKYGTVSVAHDLFLDTKKFKGRMMSMDEMVSSIKRDIDHAKKLKAGSIRVIVNTPAEVVEAAAPYARDAGIKLGVEIHSPFTFNDPWIKAHLDVAERVGFDVVGCVPDLGIFVERFPRIIGERAIRDGADEKLIADIKKNYDDGGDTKAYAEKIESMGVHPATLNYARTCTHFCNEDPKELTKHVELINHIHAKFYEMLPSGEEYSIPYDKIIAALKAGGYTGYLNSEYEGNRHIQDYAVVDSYGQVKLHQDMMKRLIEG
jgi:sugar phosphate isomerase/epimerase